MIIIIIIIMTMIKKKQYEKIQLVTINYWLSHTDSPGTWTYKFILGGKK
jgi:hypothetical protein